MKAPPIYTCLFALRTDVARNECLWRPHRHELGAKAASPLRKRSICGNASLGIIWPAPAISRASDRRPRAERRAAKRAAVPGTTRSSLAPSSSSTSETMRSATAMSDRAASAAGSRPHSAVISSRIVRANLSRGCIWLAAEMRLEPEDLLGEVASTALEYQGRRVRRGGCGEPCRDGAATEAVEHRLRWIDPVGYDVAESYAHRRLGRRAGIVQQARSNAHSPAAIPRRREPRWCHR